MSIESSCYLTNFKHSFHLLMKTSSNVLRNPHDINFNVDFFQKFGLYFCFSDETFKMLLMCPQVVFLRELQKMRFLN